jgi:hypothetical protein
VTASLTRDVTVALKRDVTGLLKRDALKKDVTQPVARMPSSGAKERAEVLVADADVCLTCADVCLTYA